MANTNKLPFEVFEYTTDNFGGVILKSAPVKNYMVVEKPSFRFLAEYLPKLGASSMVLESNYIDFDFSRDFSKYYARCFKRFERHCHRVHFFNIKFCTEDLIKTLQDVRTAALTPNNLQDSYLGFIILRPLPETFIGRTCLKVLPDNSQQEIYVTKPYITHLYGIRLTIESLAFQEQDSATSAWASIALWTNFQITSHKFHHSLLAPVEITETATTIPSTFSHFQGLNILQMSQAIRSVNLEPLIINPTDEFSMKLFLYSYLRSGIPVVMTYNQYQSANPQGSSFLHAVTVAGYSLKPQPTQNVSEKDSCLLAYRINKIYVHNDQVGPFSPMTFITETNFSLWPGDDVRAQVVHLLVALPSHIRITLPTVKKFLTIYDTLYRTLNGDNEKRLEWDLNLCNAATFKGDLRQAAYLPAQDRFELVTKSLPHYMWKARAFLNGSLLTDLLFDATGLEQGDVFLFAIDYDAQARDFRSFVKSFTVNFTSNHPARISTQRFLDLYLKDDKKY